jgi:hypothetical protein
MQIDTKRATDSADDTTAMLERRTQQEATNSSPECGTELTRRRRCDQTSSASVIVAHAPGANTDGLKD